MDTSMHRLIFLACFCLANLSFAQKLSERLALPPALQGELPWFAMVAMDNEGTYNGVLNRDQLQSIVKQKNSRRVVFAFYATWCVSCKESLAKLSNNAAELEKNGVVVILANVGEEKDYAEINKWVSGYVRGGWYLGFDKFNNVPTAFGLSKKGAEMPLPGTLLLNKDLRPLLLLGNEGDDFIKILIE